MNLKKKYILNIDKIEAEKIDVKIAILIKLLR